MENNLGIFKIDQILAQFDLTWFTMLGGTFYVISCIL